MQKEPVCCLLSFFKDISRALREKDVNWINYIANICLLKKKKTNPKPTNQTLNKPPPFSRADAECKRICWHASVEEHIGINSKFGQSYVSHACTVQIQSTYTHTEHFYGEGDATRREKRCNLWRRKTLILQRTEISLQCLWHGLHRIKHFPDSKPIGNSNSKGYKVQLHSAKISGAGTVFFMLLRWSGEQMWQKEWQRKIYGEGERFSHCCLINYWLTAELLKTPQLWQSPRKACIALTASEKSCPLKT